MPFHEEHLELLWAVWQFQCGVAAVGIAVFFAYSLFSGDGGEEETKASIAEYAEASGIADRKRFAKMKVLAIVNPFGGGGKARKAYDTILKPMCDALGVTVEIKETQSQGHGVVLGKEAGTSGEWTLIVSMSGDGVVHEIVQGLAAANNGSMGVPLAVLPCGSSNGLSMSFYGSTDVLTVTKKIFSAECAARPSNLIEMVQLTGKDAGKSELDVMGLSQAVCSDMNYMCEVQMRWMNAFPCGQKIKELLATVKVMVQLKSHKVKVAMKIAPLSETDTKENNYRTPEALGMTALSAAPVGVDGGDDNAGGGGGGVTGGGGEWFEIDGSWLWAEALSIPYLAYDMKMAPGKAATDGTLDLILSTGHSLFQLIGSLMKVEEGRHVEDPWFYRYKVTELVFTPADPAHTYYMSGEAIGQPGETVHVKTHPGKALLWF